jgi:hypothetical protein
MTTLGDLRVKEKNRKEKKVDPSHFSEMQKKKKKKKT